MSDDNDEILYHYCSTEAFYSIIKNRSIWLSSAAQSNDYMEGKLLFKSLREGLKSAKEYKEERNRIISLLEIVESHIFCLSEEKDLLSQWRGYANNASGVAIGFSKKHLGNQFCDELTSLEKISYQNKDELTTSAEKVEAPIFLDISEKTIEEFIKKTVIQSYKIKTDAFHEEKEWRLIQLLYANIPHSFRIETEQIIPYTQKIIEPDNELISKIIIEPRHKTPIRVVERFLKHSGFKGISVHPSDATYQ